MKKAILRLPALIIILSIILALSASAYYVPKTAINVANCKKTELEKRVLSASGGDITVSEKTAATSAGALSERNYSYQNGDELYMMRLETSGAVAAPVLLSSVYYPGSSGSYRVYNDETLTWESFELSSGTLKNDNYFVSVDGADLYLSLPQVYNKIENGCIRELAPYAGYVIVEKDAGGFWFSIYSQPVPENCSVEWMYLVSDGELVDWTVPTASALWANYRFVGTDNRWCYDGYYYISPDSYEPCGEDVFRNLPAAYNACSFIYVDSFRAAKDMGVAMLDVMLELQNSWGFIETKAYSQWLGESYGIGAGFYDTRFNNDFFSTLLMAADRYGISEFKDGVRKYLEFFTLHAKVNGYELTGADQTSGLLVQDYWCESGGSKTHTSLNHQAAEIILLYNAAVSFNNNAYSALADKMLNGIRLTCASWVMDSSDLYYAYTPDKMLEGDYPYLTYNDLYKLQNVLASRGQQPDGYVAYLMQAKKSYMDKVGITGYLGFDKEK